MTIEVETDRNKCQGFGKCVHWAPATFALDTENKVVLGDSDASEDEMLIRAAKSCPYRVITVSSAERGQIFPPVKKPAA
jgi:ferredoxin